MNESAHNERSIVGVEVRRHLVTGEVADRLYGVCGVQPEEPIVIAVSGGPDSLALLAAIVAVRHRVGVGTSGIIAVHVHHHLRSDADQDARLAHAAAAALGVSSIETHIHPAEVAGNRAAVARRMRYDALERIARDHDARVVSVAHHAEDQLETILMAIGRGSDLAGLAAMPWRREGGGDVSIVRPLLAVAKADLIDLCRTAGLQWAEDPGNLDPSTVRGALRVEVRPTLERLWPRIALHAAGTAKSLQAVLASVDEQVKQIFGGREVPAMWPRRTLALVPAVVLGRGLRAVALQHDPSLADALGRAVVEPPVAAIRDGERRPRRYNWPGGLEIQVSSRKVELVSC